MKHTHVRIDEKTKVQLQYLSAISGLSMAQILREIMNNLTELSVMYKHGCTLGISNRISENTVYITIHGVSPSFACGTSPNDAEMHKDAKTALNLGE